MDKSVPFRFLFWGTIVLFTAAIILSIIFPFTNCYNSSYYYSCSWYNSYYYYECSTGYSTYCCSTSSYSYCGNSSYCIPKPNYYNYGRPCMGFIIAAWVLYGVSFLMAIGVFIMFCQLRDRVRQGAYANLAVNPGNVIVNNQPNYQPPPIYGNPVMYSDNQAFVPPVRNIE